LVVAIVLPARAALALELGFSPSDVFPVWININQTLITYAKHLPADDDWQQRLAAMAPRKFRDKVPGDVLALAEAFNRRASHLRQGPPVHKEESVFEKEVRFLFKDNLQATPSLVLLRSSHLLVQMVEAFLDISNENQLIGRFFAETTVSGKTPSDVFGQVDLALRRLEKILARERPAT
jgi:hypothetical protein